MGGAPSKSAGVEQTLSNERHEIPGWVPNELGVNRNGVVQLEVTSTSIPLYDALTKYFAQRAVDVGTDAPSLNDRIHSDPLKEEREYPGKLTTIQTPPASFNDRWRLFARTEAETKNIGLRVTYTIGYGCGKLKTNPDDDESSATGDQIVLFQHYARGEPVEENRTLNVYRVLVLYATNDAIIKTLNREALNWYHTRKNLVLAVRGDKYVLYTLHCESWMCHGHRPSRPCSSIILAPGVQESMLSDVRSFFTSEAKNWYSSHGVPYRRSYLLFGPPGTGKTSMIRAVAGEQKLKACFMSFTDKDFGDHTLIRALNNLPKPCVLVFEDIDALFKKRKNVTGSLLTFSGLLNAVDGIVSTEGTIIMMTTNHMDQLDPALLRCGRIDRRFEFCLPGHDEIARYYRTFYPNAPIEYSTKFANKVLDRDEKTARSLATLQQHFIFCREESAEVALEKLDEFFETHFPNGTEDTDIANGKEVNANELPANAVNADGKEVNANKLSANAVNADGKDADDGNV